jgi:hypothetical protein
MSSMLIENINIRHQNLITTVRTFQAKILSKPWSDCGYFEISNLLTVLFSISYKCRALMILLRVVHKEQDNHRWLVPRCTRQCSTIA